MVVCLWIYLELFNTPTSTPTQPKQWRTTEHTAWRD
jgi:hypothetical protein